MCDDIVLDRLRAKYRGMWREEPVEGHVRYIVRKELWVKELIEHKYKVDCLKVAIDKLEKAIMVRVAMEMINE